MHYWSPMPNWKESQDYYFWPCSPQEGTFSALMGFCYCWLPSVWHRASGVKNCLESCMKYNRARAICCSTFQRDVYFEEKKKGKKNYCPWQKKTPTKAALRTYASRCRCAFKSLCQHWHVRYGGDKSSGIYNDRHDLWKGTAGADGITVAGK